MNNHVSLRGEPFNELLVGDGPFNDLDAKFAQKFGLLGGTHESGYVECLEIRMLQKSA